MAALSFLTLPSETRNHIYSYCTPVNGYTSDYAGLYLSCKQVKHELDGEASSTFRTIISRVAAEWPHAAALRIARPTNYAKMSTLTLEMPRSLHDMTGILDYADQFPRFPLNWTDYQKDRRILLEPRYPNDKLEMCLAPFFSLYLEKLGFSFYDDIPHVPPFEQRKALHGIFEDLGNVLTSAPDDRLLENFRLEGRPRAKRIIIEWEEQSMKSYKYGEWYKQRFCRRDPRQGRLNLVHEVKNLWRKDPEEATHIPIDGFLGAGLGLVRWLLGFRQAQEDWLPIPPVWRKSGMCLEICQCEHECTHRRSFEPRLFGMRQSDHGDENAM
ncbi:hypothetical protein K505DRAFT_340450 [Melanomma pulvis-pyrius CBS 109.77]|uniref:Uncharacterized protein n=1 Tax=Melanomma pulvis-pyrius CBS 109.77 TaxID=1314802 RepID=A0A6A6X2I9_9PLEO|nr:hypothetical protein K505DRAFT_340450 [Melanomma pulvis-pyrius CBS 109.77]